MRFILFTGAECPGRGCSNFTKIMPSILKNQVKPGPQTRRVCMKFSEASPQLGQLGEELIRLLYRLTAVGI
ncbi:hypothetical protein ES319_A01G091800v1 [Gossypium barbadense]|uniref:Uncharacterized protein n=2 Tax=Gossypium TaxID=3633 RepID=A0A5J5WVC1_GOSBA|nr:hypothetical protein ES319_A01G091800v1 [Gossypium barbadense]TYH30494.1 hypothetical protein ES288_A01G100000v1 [Gossypium darwinii]